MELLIFTVYEYMLRMFNFFKNLKVKNELD